MPSRGAQPASAQESPIRVVTPKRKKILIVDDDAVLLKALSLKLKSEGYEAFTCADANDSIEISRACNPDVILLDLDFPPDLSCPGAVAWDGLRLMNWMKLVNSRKIPVLIVTASDASQYRSACFAAGAVGYFEKPFQPSAIVTAIERILSSQPKRDSGSYDI